MLTEEISDTNRDSVDGRDSADASPEKGGDAAPAAAGGELAPAAAATPVAGAPAAEDVPSVTGEGTCSDGKGNMKKVLFLSGGKDKDGKAAPGLWLEGMSKRASAASAGMSDAFAKMTAPKPAPEKADFDEGGDAADGDGDGDGAAAAKRNPRLEGMMEGARKSLDAAGTRMSGLMASMKSGDKGDAAAAAEPAADGEAGEQTSRLAALKIAMAHLSKRAPTAEDQIADLKAEVADLKATVAALAAKVEALEAGGETGV